MGTGDDSDVVLKLYQMEYEQCVSTYQDLYNSIWRIFSYMSAVTAALVVFAREFLTPSGTVIVSTWPILLWCFCIYIPMDRYGALRSKRLAEIEKELNAKYGVRLEHFGNIEKAREPVGWRVWEALKRWRVRYGVYLLASVLGVILICSIFAATTAGFYRKPQGPQTFQGRVELTAPVPCRPESPPANFK